MQATSCCGVTAALLALAAVSPAAMVRSPLRAAFQPGVGLNMSCDSEISLLDPETGPITAIRAVCVDQMKESCAGCSQGDRWPTSCRSAQCARVAIRANTGCAHFLSSSDFLKEYKIKFDTLVRTCTASRAPASGPIYPMVNYSRQNRQSDPIRGCGGQLVSRDDSSNGANGFEISQLVTIQPQAGTRTLLTLSSLFLPNYGLLTIFDGNIDEGEPLVKFTGSELPANNTVAAKGQNNMTIRFNWPEDQVLAAFTLAIGCACIGSSGCSGHGQCVGGHCNCDPGYAGQSCADANCVGVNCIHGTCHTECHGE